MSVKEFEAGMAAGARPFAEKYDQLGEKLMESKLEEQKKSDLLFDELRHLNKLQQLGLKDTALLTDLDADERTFLVSALHQLTSGGNSPSDEQTHYLAALVRYLGMTDFQQSIPLASIENVSDIEAQKLMLTVVLEFLYLYNCDWAFSDQAQDFVDSFQVNRKTYESLRAKVESEAQALGADGLARKFDITPGGDANFSTSVAGDIPTQASNAQSHRMYADTAPYDEQANNSDFTKTKHLIGSRLLTIFPTEASASKQSSQEKRANQFKNKYVPQVVEKAVIALAETPSVKILFTICGMYILPFLAKKPVFTRYADLDMDHTQLQSDKDGKPLALLLAAKGGTPPIKIESRGVDITALLDMIIDLAKLPAAERDTPIPITELHEREKLVYAKLIVLFSRQCNLELTEALRFASDLNLSVEAFKEVLNDSSMPRAGSEMDELISTLLSNLPYPSEESVSYTLIQAFASLIQYSTGRTRELTASERQAIREVAQNLKIENAVLDDLIRVAQIPYRILKGDITKKEINLLGQALATTATGIGMPVVTFFASNALFWNLSWFMFIPGIGTAIAAGALGVAAATAIVRKVNGDATTELKDDQYKQLELVKQSYLALAQKLISVYDRSIPAQVLDDLKRAATRTDVSITIALLKEFQKEEKAFFLADRIPDQEG